MVASVLPLNIKSKNNMERCSKCKIQTIVTWNRGHKPYKLQHCDWKALHIMPACRSNMPRKLKIQQIFLFLHPVQERNIHCKSEGQMQGIGQATRSCQETLKLAILQHWRGRSIAGRKNVFSRLECVTTSNPTMEQKGLENTTVAEVLMTKGEEKSGSWLWCRTNDTVYDAAKHMAENNIGSLVVLKPGEPKYIAGIFTERDYMKKIIAQGRCSKYTKVGEIMTDENKLVTVSSGTNILQAMQLLTEYQIRHVPVIDGKIVGMISIVDIVRAVVEQQTGEVKRLNEFIKGEYY